MTSADVSIENNREGAVRSTAPAGAPAVWNSRSVMAVSAFAFTSLTSAGLLFSVQPLIAKALLPLLGGTPAVWVTCMAFFQAALLIGYLYVHFATRWLGVRYQAILHVVLLVLSFTALPLALPQGWVPPESANPIPWLTSALAILIGAPFVVLSATAPMLQKWYSHTGYSGAEDPYFLYVPSNIGSLVALASYPFLIEPNIGLLDQAAYWSYGYFLFAGLIALCAAILWRTYAPDTSPAAPAEDAATVLAPETPVAAGGEVLPAASNALRLRWLALSFAPSSLLLGVTTYLTTDVAAVPLFWVVPLALYLLTFILVFARRQVLPHEMMVKLLPYFILPLVLVMLWGMIGSAWVTISLHISAFFVATMVCHGELVRNRPRAKDLTEFYLWMSVGGLAGGVFNAILAPFIFPLVLEYPIALVLVSVLRPGTDDRDGPRDRLLDVVLPVVAGAALIWAIIVNDYAEDNVGWIVLTAVIALIGLTWSPRRLRFGVWMAALMIATTMYNERFTDTIFRDRSFFGVSSVIDYNDGWRAYHHGTTLHGMQNTVSAERLDPTTYFTYSGPFGDIMEAYLDTEEPQEIVVMGLGVGTVACYGKEGDSWIFLEIDPLVLDVAERFFSYLSDCPGNNEVRLGDGRLTVGDIPDGSADIIIADAFSSDSVPVHLITREAIELYQAKLKPGGVMVFNITNRYVDLEPMLADLAATLDLAAVVRKDFDVAAEDSELYDKRSSSWLVLGPEGPGGPILLSYGGWARARIVPGISHWTDDFSNIASVLN